MSEDDPEVTEALHRLTRIMNHVHEQDLLKENGWFDSLGAGDAAKNLFGVDVTADKYDFPTDTPEDSYTMGGSTVGDVKKEIKSLLDDNAKQVTDRDTANTKKKECNEKITSNNKKLQEKIAWIRSAIEWKKKSPKV